MLGAVINTIVALKVDEMAVIWIAAKQWKMKKLPHYDLKNNMGNMRLTFKYLILVVGVKVRFLQFHDHSWI